MAPFLLRTTFAHVSALPEDQTVTDTAWLDGITPAAASALVIDFWNTIGPFARPGEYLSSVIDRGATASRNDAFLLDTAGKLSGADPLGSPSFTAQWDLIGSTVTLDDLPAECACALSFRADYGAVPEESGATRPRARRRGRFFVGPLNTGATNNPIAAGTVVRPGSNFMSDLISNAQAELFTNGGDLWGVWSRADATVRAITTGWVDNAFDTIRSRGEAPTSRVTFP